MIEVELQIPTDSKSDVVVKVVEQICAAHHLTCALKGTLASYPGCIHWHFKQDSHKGTLEITWWERENRLWFKVAKGRIGEWIDVLLPKLKKQIESSLKKDPKGFQNL
ncbi:MAG TPA: hypothetical protein VJM08_05210 [Anaerolineales bacterium]|nr:hypothetical protein [Anaerolineales bacterium]